MMIQNRDKEREYMFKKAEAEMKTKDPKKVKRGKKSKAQGGAFELRTRKDLEEKGWICSKWQNNVEFKKVMQCSTSTSSGTGGGLYYIDIGKLVPAKAKFRGIGIPMMMTGGMPDFVCMRKVEHIQIHNGDSTQISIKHHNLYEVIGVESKLTGTLDKLEKEKCKWLLENNIFSKILVSKKLKIKNKIVVEYIDFVDIEKRMK